MRIAITGASGLIGTALTDRLAAARHTVVPVVRRAARDGEISWDPAAGRLDPADLVGIDAVVNLAGAGIGDHRWTDEYKRTLVDSRVQGTRLLADALAGLGTDGPRVLVSGSAIGYYGDRGDELLYEGSAPGDDFLAELCVAWESATEAAEAEGVRVAHVRTGIVLSRHGGALRKLLPIFKLGLGGKFGNGRQWMSWISIDDEVAAIEHLLTGDVSGAVNLVSPAPCRNADFVRTLAHVLHRPSLLPIPAFGPKLLLGSELAQALLFDGQRIEPRVLVESGYEHRHADLETALRAVLGR
jgi:uncharacterized protein (TIGR01777 family)